METDRRPGSGELGDRGDLADGDVSGLCSGVRSPGTGDRKGYRIGTGSGVLMGGTHFG